MNLSEFLKKTDSWTVAAQPEALRKVIHQLARTMEESRRDEFLRMLDTETGGASVREVIAGGTTAGGTIAGGTIAEGTTAGGTIAGGTTAGKTIAGGTNAGGTTAGGTNARETTTESAEWTAGQQENYARIMTGLQEIEEGQSVLISDLNEEYDDWYNPGVSEFVYNDPDGLLNIVEDACALLHKCVKEEAYGMAGTLAESLFELRVQIEGEYAAYDEEAFSLWELMREDLLSREVRQVLVDLLLVLYNTRPLEQRPKVLYDAIRAASCSDFSLEALMQASSTDLERIDDFLELWIGYLGQLEEGDGLLREAVALQNDPEKMLEHARTLYGKHPSLYAQYLQNNPADSSEQELLTVAQEAMSRIADDYIVRSRVAILAAGYANRLDRTDAMEDCLLEAFRSDTTPVNYLRLVTVCRDPINCRSRMREIIDFHAPEGGNKIDISSGSLYGSNERARNQVGSVSLHMLYFLDGDFQRVLREGMNEQKGVGWSYTFMKNGLASFLLYLYEGQTPGRGCSAMLDRIRREMFFLRRDAIADPFTQEQIGEWDGFWSCFQKWKSMTPRSQEEKEQILEKIRSCIELRVSGIMGGNHRKYYGECAAYIAAFGEVLESMGHSGAKNQFMLDYKTAYSRRTAFHGELRAFGMRDR